MRLKSYWSATYYRRPEIDLSFIPVKQPLLQLFIAILFLHALPVRAANQPPGDPTGPDTAWFTDAGFGIFLHWGAYSTAAGPANTR